jgi:hypothetical protein
MADYRVHTAEVIRISQHALRDGCERAHDLYMLNRLRGAQEAAECFESVYRALGIDSAMREQLELALRELVPVKGVPALEATSAVSMLAGVLVGLLIADSALPVEELDLPVVRTR